VGHSTLRGCLRRFYMVVWQGHGVE
jgi:hypothetical protein